MANEHEAHALSYKTYFLTWVWLLVLTALALGLAAALLAIDLLAWRVVAAMFDRERLVTGRPR